jgi:hypothetical protein
LIFILFLVLAVFILMTDLKEKLRRFFMPSTAGALAEESMAGREFVEPSKVSTCRTGRLWNSGNCGVLFELKNQTLGITRRE